MAEDVTDIGAGREHGVDGRDEFALIRKGTLSCLGWGGAACGPEADSRKITATIALVIGHARKMHQVSATPGSGIVLLPGRPHTQFAARRRVWTTRRRTMRL